jgi:hypothetical protein
MPYALPQKLKSNSKDSNAFSIGDPFTVRNEPRSGGAWVLALLLLIKLQWQISHKSTLVYRFRQGPNSLLRDTSKGPAMQICIPVSALITQIQGTSDGLVDLRTGRDQAFDPRTEVRQFTL